MRLVCHLLRSWERREWRIGRRFTSLPQYKLWFQCNVVNFSSMLSGLQYSAFCNSVNYVEVHNYFLMSSLVNWLFVINRSNVATASHPYKCRKRESILLKYPYLVVIIRKSLLLPWYACLKIFFSFLCWIWLWHNQFSTVLPQTHRKKMQYEAVWVNGHM